MASDILNHRPARPETVLPGHWLIDLPVNATINIKRYRATATTTASDVGGEAVADYIEAGWRTVNSYHHRSEGAIGDTLRNGCGVVAASAAGRELWCFTSNTEAEDLAETSQLEAILPDLEPLDPSQLLHCPRHGHDRSCLSRPSTSQRPLKSCDVRFQPQGEHRVIWEKLGQAIYERAEWGRGRRIMASRPHVGISLFPEPTGLLLKLRHSTPHAVPKTDQLVTILPSGFRGAVIGHYQPTAAESATLTSSFELALGSGWKEEQHAHRLKAQLANKAYHDYTTVWIPDPSSAQSRDLGKSAEWKNGKGVLAVWPTHLVSHHIPTRTEPPPTRSTVHRTADAHLDLMVSASGLFDAASKYREPMQEMTPPEDTSLEDNLRQANDSATSPPASSDKGTELLSNGNGLENVDRDDDLEDLFASRPGSPDAGDYESDGHFEMFGEEDIRDRSMGNNAHLIDYDDVVMASPPREIEHERRASVREIMGDVDGGDEAGIANVTEDDFNFFDSPAAADIQTPAETSNEPDEISPESPTVQTEDIDKVDESEPILGPSEVQLHESPSRLVTPPPAEPASTSPTKVEDPETTVQQSEPSAPIETHAVTSGSSVKGLPRPDNLVPETFSPLALGSQTTFKYSLPSPAPTPPGMNDDLIARLKKGADVQISYDYSSAWRLGTPESETEAEEYTGPPSPVSEAGRSEIFTERPAANQSVRPIARASGQLQYDGITCVGARLVALVSRAAWAEESLIPWKASWENDQHRSNRRDNGLSSSPVAVVSKKRKRSDAFTPDIADLDALAKQVIGNQAYRRLLTTRRRLSTREADISDDALTRRGVSLADLTASVEEAGDDQHGPVLHYLAPCTIHTGYHSRVVQISIASLQYWLELGLQPLSGPKDIKATIIVENIEDGHRARKVATELGDSYGALQLGNIEWSTECGTEGMINYDRMKGNLPLLKWLNDHGGNAVIFFMLRSSSLFPDTKILLGDSFRSKLAPNQLIHYLPLSTEPRNIATAARDVYDRLPRQLRVVDPRDAQPPWYHYPSFTLAPPEPPEAHLTLQWPLKSFDVFGTWRWIHAAYVIDGGTKSMTIFVADAEGDNWDVQVLQDSDMDWDKRIETIWDIVIAFAEAASVEWRASISSLGFMDPAEAKAWQDLFIVRPEPMSIFICDAARTETDTSRPRPIPPNVPPGIINDLSASIIDESLSATYCTMSTRQPVPCGNEIIYSDTSFLLSLASSATEYYTSTYHVLAHRPAPGKEEEETEKELATEMYRSACWARMKFGMEGLPAALAAVKAVGEVLEEVSRSDD